ncbi:hypothetical protein FHX16_003972 [Rhizobium sp. BK661]|nr:hypothetical protein [Rhizobium sp. BK661]
MVMALNWIAALAGLLAALFWYRAAIAEVPAPKDTAGVGALLGGWLISLSKGKRIDLHKTLELQARWNTRAATAACIGALATAASWTAAAFGWQ